MSLSVQWWTMLTMLLSGIGMGVVFDGYRVVSDELRINRWWIPVLDLLYWIAATLIVFHVLSASNEGEVRTYVFLGLLLGIACHYWLFSKLVEKLVHALIRGLRALIQLVITMFMLLVVRPLQLLFRLAKLIFAFLAAFTMFLFRIVVQLVRPLWLLVLFLMRPLLRPVGNWLGQWFRPLLLKWRIKERCQAAFRYTAELWRRWKNRKKDDKR
ncbi:spore cortex biosynthesis protein YabQ [Paenibacillus oenotherae]|uniref:Spore cortex biosynthesis protein YabQ n=1 Tax=Paenibacillus oenotherae TaxID=1435645 RepID=A0ABS7DBU8_9BACL|nr:spore cortex biosynthesis protein YabQ [Paenibacillus oenotherae]